LTRKYIPYSTHVVSQQDIDAVVSTLQSGWLTGGKTTQRFETAVAEYCGVGYGAAVSSGTAALHAAVRAIKIEADDEIIVPALSFVATANAVLYENGRPVFCDVTYDTLLLNPDCVEELITPRTKAVIAVDYAGQLCDYKRLNSICRKNNLILIADSCHSLGADHLGHKSGSLADLTVFSFHPVKQITTGEGGMVMTQAQMFFDDIRRFRNHEMSSTFLTREEKKDFRYEIDQIGYNYRLSDIHSALGLSQLDQLDNWIKKRREIAAAYETLFADCPGIQPLATHSVNEHAYHLYVVRVPHRDKVFSAMRDAGIGVNVHYRPIHLHNVYRDRYGGREGLCPVAEKAYSSILSLPIFPGLTPEEQHYVADKLIEIVNAL
jgi:perosamine synthetase